MNLSKLLAFLESIDAKPKKGLSQNFLIDQNIIQKIVKTADVTDKDLILEIGPGPGALTEALLKAGAQVFAIEKDDKLAFSLDRLQTNDQRLHTFHQDALEFSLSELPSPLKVVANLPYQITTPILEKLFNHAKKIQTITIMVQKEVAERMVAKPSTKEYGALTLFSNYYTECKARFTVSSQCFYPKPKVDSMVVHLELRKKSPLEDPAPFFKIVRKSFQQRRKMLRSSLKSLFPPNQVEAALQKTSLSLEARPEMLSLEEWLEFYNNL